MKLYPLYFTSGNSIGEVYGQFKGHAESKRCTAAQQCAAQQCVNDPEAIKESHSFKCLGIFDCDDLFW